VFDIYAYRVSVSMIRKYNGMVERNNFTNTCICSQLVHHNKTDNYQ